MVRTFQAFIRAINPLMDNFISRRICAFVFSVNFSSLVCNFLSPKSTLMTPPFSKNHQSSRARLWMFLISTITFLMSTAFEAAALSNVGISIYSVLVGHQDLPLRERALLANVPLFKIHLVSEWLANLLV